MRWSGVVGGFNNTNEIMLDENFVGERFGKVRITEIFENRRHSRRERNSDGEWEIAERELTFRRPVPIASTRIRLVHFFVDYFLVTMAITLGVDYLVYITSEELIMLLSFPLLLLLMIMVFAHL
jgi:hypothetical protein